VRTLSTKLHKKSKHCSRDGRHPKTNAPPEQSNELIRQLICVNAITSNVLEWLKHIERIFAVNSNLQPPFKFSYQPIVSLAGIPITKDPKSPRHVEIWVKLP